MWQALEAVQMKGYVSALPGTLDAPVTEGGGNLSVSIKTFFGVAFDSPSYLAHSQQRDFDNMDRCSLA